MEVIGLDHIDLSVSDMQRAERFYDQVMQLLGFRKGDKPIAGEPHVHYFDRSLQLTIRPSKSGSVHDPYAPGLVATLLSPLRSDQEPRLLLHPLSCHLSSPSTALQ